MTFTCSTNGEENDREEMNPKNIRFVNEIKTFMRSLKFLKVKITFNTLKKPIEWK